MLDVVACLCSLCDMFGHVANQLYLCFVRVFLSGSSFVSSDIIMYGAFRSDLSSQRIRKRNS